jgi:uncharacterized protein YciU (UPF0263 family)
VAQEAQAAQVVQAIQAWDQDQGHQVVKEIYLEIQILLEENDSDIIYLL